MEEIVGYCEECGTGYERGLTFKMPGDNGIVWYICSHENCGGFGPRFSLQGAVTQSCAPYGSVLCHATLYTPATMYYHEDAAYDNQSRKYSEESS